MAGEPSRSLLRPEAADAVRLAHQAATDPLLAALIARLPPAGEIWPAKKRGAWMQMIWTTFDLIYEAEQGETIEMPAFLKQHGAVVDQTPAAVPAAEPKRAAPYAFMIDKQGFARRGDGTRILPPDVGGVIYDQRGEGDFATIIWADETMGVRGLQLDIAPAF